jgi:hypothetical protein
MPYFKEQAPKRRAMHTIPCFDGNATQFIQIFRADAVWLALTPNPLPQEREQTGACCWFFGWASGKGNRANDKENGGRFSLSWRAG